MEEECQSSESGWTMYIGSPVEGGGEEDDDNFSDPNGYVADIAEAENFHGENNWMLVPGTKYNNHDENSDDSMASDASSGPSLREKTWEIKRDSVHQEGNKVGSIRDHHHHSSSKYKDKKAAAKKNRQEKKDNNYPEAEVNAAAAKGAGSKHFVQGNKVRKNLGWGKQTKS
ncbi:OLC1v1014000C1 [Oldenlandia corymbosa var. corymbosa]|uniref:OLC1v1014000C1 n=1 Tax=Oldenlandia corymbosa var. corymbosa TaxID=529605 RepID=A0AAV1E0I4_OLDCO|nr:OLC1v1014000C1 [Oldenlandia corymbosa var. corymbosa]